MKYMCDNFIILKFSFILTLTCKMLTAETTTTAVTATFSTEGFGNIISL